LLIQPSDRGFGISFMADVENRDPHVRRLPPEESSDHLPDDQALGFTGAAGLRVASKVFDVLSVR
jgi:hypothetical protein